MKHRTAFFQATLLVMACLVSCTDQDFPVMETLPDSVMVVFPDLPQGDDPQDDTINNFIHLSTVSDYLNPALIYDSIADIDGNIYATIKIGSQTWMAENLKTTKYNDGAGIPYVIDNNVWVTLRTGAYRWYDNNSYYYKNLYGALYNWYTVKTGKLCPTGWHVPSDEDWIKLEMTLGMTEEQANSWGESPGIDGRGTDQGIQMKTVNGWKQWEGQGSGGTNTSGFSALPAGESAWGGVWPSSVYTYYYGKGICTTWWESTSEGGGRAIDCVNPGIGRGVFPAFCGLSIRCVKN